MGKLNVGLLGIRNLVNETKQLNIKAELLGNTNLDKTKSKQPDEQQVDTVYERQLNCPPSKNPNIYESFQFDSITLYRDPLLWPFLKLSFTSPKLKETLTKVIPLFMFAS